MNDSKARTKYIIIVILIVVLGIVLGFPLSAIFASIFIGNISPNSLTYTMFFCWFMTSAILWLILFGLSLLIIPSFRSYYISLLNKNSKDIEMIQMVGTNQSFNSGILSGIIYNETEYTVKITYKNGSSAVKKVSGKWLNKHSDLLKL